MDDKERIRELEQEIEYLNKEKRAVLEAIEFAGNLSNFQTSLNKIDNPQVILEQTNEKLRQVLGFKALSFYLVNEEDSSFYQALTEPETAAESINKEVDAFIEDKTFAWALRRNKPVIVSSINNQEKVVLHSMNTSSRNRGIFIGILASPEEEIHDLSRFLFSIAIIACSNALESFELYQRIRDNNKELEQNILKLKQSGKKLQEKEEKYRALFQQSTHSIILYDPETRLPVEFNDPANKNLGYTRKEFEKLKMEDYSLTSLEEIQARVQETIDRGQISFETRHKRKDGRIRDIVVNARSICIGGRTYLLTLLNDITEIKKTDTERIQLEKQLRQSQKMESLGTLAGGIAHDFNNILGVILGYGELALMELPDTSENPIRQNVESLLKAVNRAKELVRQILTFSRQTEESRRPINVNTIVKETLKLLRSTLPTSIDIKQNIVGESNLVLGTPTQIQQVIMNLCTNALHAMGGNRGTLTVDIQAMDVKDKVVKADMVAFKEMEPGPYLLISVGDTGHGISPGILEQVFDPYFTTKQPGEGTGLGLSMVHGIIKNYKGNIAINSQMGNGTQVKVWFPTVDTALEPEEEEFQILPLGKEKILMVDDEEELLKSNRQILEQLNYSVATCSSSMAALEIFRETPEDFDLILTDMSMPEMTGLQLTEEVFKIRPDIPIILCTGFSEFIDAKEAKAIGIKEFLMKPVDKQTLANIIRKALDKR